MYQCKCLMTFPLQHTKPGGGVKKKRPIPSSTSALACVTSAAGAVVGLLQCVALLEVGQVLLEQLDLSGYVLLQEYSEQLLHELCAALLELHCAARARAAQLGLAGARVNLPCLAPAQHEPAARAWHLSQKPTEDTER